MFRRLPDHRDSAAGEVGDRFKVSFYCLFGISYFRINAPSVFKDGDQVISAFREAALQTRVVGKAKEWPEQQRRYRRRLIGLASGKFAEGEVAEISGVSQQVTRLALAQFQSLDQ